MCGGHCRCVRAARVRACRARAPVSACPHHRRRPPTGRPRWRRSPPRPRDRRQAHLAPRSHHVTAGARLDRSGGWLRPFTYGDWREEYRAVRERVSLMDVGTLGKFSVRGPDAERWSTTCSRAGTDDLPAGRSRYVLTLDEAGYVVDDGLLRRTGRGTSTSPRPRAERRGWTPGCATGPTGSTSGAHRGSDGPAGRDRRDRPARARPARAARPTTTCRRVPYLGFTDITVAGVPCRAIRIGFTGELAFELHHPRRRGPELWSALADAGASLRPASARARRARAASPGEGTRLPGPGHAARRHARQAGHVVGGGHGQAGVRRQGRARAHGRAADVATAWWGSSSRRAVGRSPSCAASRCRRGTRWSVASRRPSTRSPLGRAIGLGWMRTLDGGFPDRATTGSGTTATVVPTPFYDPDGGRLRG